MMARPETDRLLERLADLEVLQPRAARANGLRRRCQKAFADHARKAAQATRRRQAVARALEPAVVAAVCGGYLVGIVEEVIRLLDAR
jgi:hypothetical protein